MGFNSGFKGLKTNAAIKDKMHKKTAKSQQSKKAPCEWERSVSRTI